MSQETMPPDDNSAGFEADGAGATEAPTNGSAAGTAPELPAFDVESTDRGGRGEVDISMLLDVPVTLSVEIGRTRVPIRKLLSFSQGSIVELDRDISAPLDLMVNGMLIARGEVVESQGKFGLRLVSVVSASERLKILR